jgi:hypothetical protein
MEVFAVQPICTSILLIRVLGPLDINRCGSIRRKQLLGLSAKMPLVIGFMQKITFPVFILKTFLYQYYLNFS